MEGLITQSLHLQGRKEMELTAIVPFWNGHKTIERLLNSLPSWMNVIIADDCSDEPLQLNRENAQVVRLSERSYFSGAVNFGARFCSGDFVVLNQDAWVDGTEWIDVINANRARYATIGDGVMKHPAWTGGYVQGTLMYVNRDAWDLVGGFNEEYYPLWGATCEWQLRLCRAGYKALPLEKMPSLVHGEGRRKRHRQFGSSITEALRRERSKRHLFIRTPPMVSVIVPCYNYGRYLNDAVNSLLGGHTSLGMVAPQTFQSFEIIIVDDCSTDNSWEVAKKLNDPTKGIRAIRTPKNFGCPGAINYGVEHSYGKFIHVMSADDMRKPDTLERYVDVLLLDEKVLAYGDVQTFGNGKMGRILKMRKSFTFDELLDRNPIPAGSMYSRKAFDDVGGYSPEMRDGREDWAMNIALHAIGYCGYHIGGEPVNLYRREGQNRSLRTSQDRTYNWRAHYRNQLRKIYPNLYKGDKSMACCGGGRGSNGKGKGSNGGAPPQHVPGEVAGMVLLEYVGGKSGIMTFFGHETGMQYRFGGKRRYGNVAIGDVSGMLNIMNKNRPVFKQAKVVTPNKMKKRSSQTAWPEIAHVDSDIMIDISDGISAEEASMAGKVLHQKKSQDALTGIVGVTEKIAAALIEAGYNTVNEIAAATVEQLAMVKGIGQSRAERIIGGARAI